MTSAVAEEVAGGGGREGGGRGGRVDWMEELALQ